MTLCEVTTVALCTGGHPLYSYGVVEASAVTWLHCNFWLQAISASSTSDPWGAITSKVAGASETSLSRLRI